jgi:hypothetical protein
MQIDPTKSAIQNLLALVDGSNPSAPNLPNEVTVSGITTGSFANGTDTKVTLTGTGPQGNYANFTGSVDVTYKRLTLATEAASPTGPVSLSLGTSKDAALATVAQYFGFIPTEISAPSFTPQGAAGNQTVTLQASGSLIYEDGSTDITINWTSPKTVLLTHFDGAVTDTSVPDVASGGSIALSGGATLTTTTKVFGTAAFQGSASNPASCASAGANNKYIMSGDFTFECFFIPNAADLSGESILFSEGTGSYIDLFHNTWYVSLGTTNVHLINGVAANLVAGTTYHVALTRQGTTVTIWVNGVSVTTASSSLPFGVSGANMNIGNYNSNGYGVKGVLDEARISNVARYTAAFTPPSAPFTLD